MADMLQPFHHRDLTSAKLVGAYRQLLDMLARHRIGATFAFVMAFTLSAEERKGFAVLDEADNPDDPWLRHYWDSQRAGGGDGWHLPEALEMVREAGGHEVASHGFCHRPLGDHAIDEAGAARELGLANYVAAVKGLELKTLVFPRNEVGNFAAVRAAGYLGFRSRLQRSGGRAMALLEEFAIWRKPQAMPPSANGLVAIPAGHFFNWRFGARRLVPPAVTRARWGSQLRQCARHGGVVHLWLHPHNLITGPHTAAVLDDVLSEIARMRDQGRIAVMTQKDYCESVA